MRRFKVTVTYEVDTATKADGRALAAQLSYLISSHTRGDTDRADNLVEETDFRFHEMLHPMDYDKPKRRPRA